MTDRKDYPIHKILEAKSSFFCPAKWTELYLYLNHGNSNSCHHPIPHKIPEHLLDNPAVLHNTPHKLKMQQLMLDGHRPDECHMCWHIEDSNPAAISDRIVKSKTWENYIPTLDVDPGFVPPMIEVVFDNYCNLSCSYCDSGQSSSWAAKIHQQPLHLVTDSRQLYSKIHIAPGSTKSTYQDAWLKWWPEIKHQVKLLKISGGEPLMSKNFWKFINSIGIVPELHLAINSNFSVDADMVHRFAAIAHNFASVTVSVSVDAANHIAEYTRQGLDYKKLLDNIAYWCSETPENCKIRLQSTVNIMGVWGLTDKFDLGIQLRQQYPTRVKDFYSTIVRAPEFQSISILPNQLKIQLSTHIQSWLDLNQQYLSPTEIIYVNKTIGYLIDNPAPMHNFTNRQLEIDFAKFLQYYDKSSKHKYQDVYPTEFLEWIQKIQAYETMHHSN